MRVSNDSVYVDDLIEAVKRSIVATNLSATNPDRDLRISLVELTLHTVATSTAGGGVELKVPIIGLRMRAGLKITKVDLHTLVIALEAKAAPGRGELRDLAVEETLVAAIDRVRATVALAGLGDDPFALRDSTLTMAFGVTSEGSIVLGFEGNLKDDVTQTLKLTLSPV